MRRLGGPRGPARLLCLGGDPLEGGGQSFQSLQALGLGGLEHESLVHDEREVDRGRVEPLLEEALADVEGPNPLGLLEAGG